MTPLTTLPAETSRQGMTRTATDMPQAYELPWTTHRRGAECLVPTWLVATLAVVILLGLAYCWWRFVLRGDR